MSCNNCNNCAQCNSNPTVPVVPAPSCPNTTACEEYFSSDCVTSTIDGTCASQLYQYDAGGGLITNNSGNPVPFSPPQELGLDINRGDTLSTILTNLVDEKNCSFNPNYIAGMLQVIQANPNHPVSQIFCNMVCACVRACDVDCGIQIVETVTFNPENTTETGFVVTFTGLLNYIYTIEVTDTNAPTPTVYSYTYPVPPIQSGATGIVNFNTNLLRDAGGNPVTTLPSGNTFEVVIVSEFNEESCSSDSFTTFTNPPESCTCASEIEVQADFNGSLVGTIGIYIWTNPILGYVPQFYEIAVIDSQGDYIVPPGNYDPTLYPLPIGAPPHPQGTMYIEFGDGILPGDEYTIAVSAVCEQTPEFLCKSDESQFPYVITAPLSCGPPDITTVTVIP